MENIGSAQRYKMVVVIIELLLLIRTGKFIVVGHEYVSYNNYMGYTIISADGENWKMLEQLKDESGKVVTANLNGVCAMP